MSQSTTCPACRQSVPAAPGIPPSLGVPTAHVAPSYFAETGPEAGTTVTWPCSSAPVIATRRRVLEPVFELDRVAVFAALDLWSEDLIEEVPLPSADDDHPEELVADLDGRPRSEGVSW